MQTKRMIMTSALALALIMTGCSGSDSNIENQDVQTQVEVTDAEKVSENTRENKDSGEDEANEAEQGAEQTTETSSESSQDKAEAAENQEQNQEQGQTENQNTDQVSVEQTETKLTQDELNIIQPNELGEVMVVMYHGLGKKNSAYVRTPDSFRADLKDYYEMGFRPINLGDYVDGNIEVEAGMTPIVLTFDDGNRSNFNLIEQDGEWVIDPDCAIGIITAFNEAHPDWALKGSFFLNGGTPFGQKEHVNYKVNWLVENGFEVGNHSYGHEDLTEQDQAGIQKTLGRNIQEIESRIEGYTVNTLALPFGKRPKDQVRYDLVTAGAYEGVPYEHKAILLVGWKPEVSVFDKSFDPLAIMRVQSGDGEFQMIHWLADYRKNPHKRFISDGNVKTITVPEKIVDRINMDLVGDKELVSYTVIESE